MGQAERQSTAKTTLQVKHANAEQISMVEAWVLVFNETLPQPWLVPLVWWILAWWNLQRTRENYSSYGPYWDNLIHGGRRDGLELHESVGHDTR